MRVKGACCGQAAGADGGFHGTRCPIGGGTVRRHDAIRHALCERVAILGTPHTSEQYVPHWHADKEKALLDIIVRHHVLGYLCVDVSLVEPVQSEAGKLSIKRREVAKHRRCPGPGLHPIVLDGRGKWGRQSDTWMRIMLNLIPKDDRQKAMAKCRAMVSRALQMTATDMQLTATHAPGGAEAQGAGAAG